MQYAPVSLTVLSFALTGQWRFQLAKNASNLLLYPIYSTITKNSSVCRVRSSLLCSTAWKNHFHLGRGWRHYGRRSNSEHDGWVNAWNDAPSLEAFLSTYCWCSIVLRLLQCPFVTTVSSTLRLFLWNKHFTIPLLCPILPRRWWSWFIPNPDPITLSYKNILKLLLPTHLKGRMLSHFYLFDHLESIYGYIRRTGK